MIRDERSVRTEVLQINKINFLYKSSKFFYFTVQPDLNLFCFLIRCFTLESSR